MTVDKRDAIVVNMLNGLNIVLFRLFLALGCMMNLFNEVCK